jgi:hypothetical protein
MAQSNPPLPLAPNSSPVTYGTILHYGLKNLAVTGILIDSYRRDQSFADTQEITNQAGITVGIRMTDFRVNVSVDGRVLVDPTDGSILYEVKVGDVLEVGPTGGKDKIVINNVSYNGQAKGFHSISISGTSYAGISELAPFGVTSPAEE